MHSHFSPPVPEEIKTPQDLIQSWDDEKCISIPDGTGVSTVLIDSMDAPAKIAGQWVDAILRVQKTIHGPLKTIAVVIQKPPPKTSTPVLVIDDLQKTGRWFT